MENNLEKQMKPIKKGFWQKVELLWDSAFEWLGQSKIGDHLKSEVTEVKTKAPVLTIIVILTMGWLCYGSYKKTDMLEGLETANKNLEENNSDNERRQKTTIANLASSIQVNNGTVQMLNLKLEEKNADIQKLTSERNSAQNEALVQRHAVASWQLLAQSGNTNTPLTERLDSLIVGLTKNTESITNVYEAVINTTKNIYANMVTETLELTDTNHFFIKSGETGRIVAVMRLSHAPVNGSLEMFFTVSGYIGGEQRTHPASQFINNIAVCIFPVYPTNSMHIMVRYIADNNVTNIYTRIPTESEGLRLDLLNTSWSLPKN